MYNIDIYKTGQYPANIDQVDIKRDWMEDTVDRHAYNCFPVSLANRLGWAISFPEDISFIWDGVSDTLPNHIQVLSGNKYCSTNRSNATVSFNTGLSARTKENVTMLIMPVPNQFISGIHTFTTLLSTSFFTGEIPCVVRVTEPGKVITIKANTPVCVILPISLSDINGSEVNIYDGSLFERAKYDGFEYAKAIEKINMLGKWSGFYRNATDHLGNKIGRHEVKAIRLTTNDKSNISLS
jgi:hypothetical protein